MDEKLSNILHALNAEYKGLANTNDASLTEEKLLGWNAPNYGVNHSEELLSPPVNDDEYSFASTLSSSDHDSDDGGYADQMLSVAVENARVNKMMLSELSNYANSFPMHSIASLQSVSLHGGIDKYCNLNRSVTFAQSFDIREYQQYSDINCQRYEGFDVEEAASDTIKLRNSNTNHTTMKENSILNHVINITSEKVANTNTEKATTKTSISAFSSKSLEPSAKAASFKDSLDLFVAFSRRVKPKKKYANPKHVLKISTLKPATFAPTNKKIRLPVLGTRKDLNILPLDAQLSMLVKDAHVKVIEAPGHIRMSMRCTSFRHNTTFPSLNSVAFSRSESTISTEAYNMMTRSKESFARYLENNVFHSSFNSRKCTPTYSQFSNFSNKYSIGFVYLVFDIQMQLLGTYDINSGSYFPGIQLAPAYFNKFRMKQKLDGSQAQVIDINTRMLPPSAFAVIPIIQDASIIYSDEVDLQLNVFSKSESIKEVHVDRELDIKGMQQTFYHQYLEALADGTHEHWLLKHGLSSILQLTEMIEAENTETLREVMNTHYATSSHLTPYIMEHMQQIKLSKRGVALSSDYLDSYITPSSDNDVCSQLSKNGSFIPFILCRSAGDAAHAKWLFQSSQISLSTTAIDSISNLVVKYMTTHHLLPYTTVHIEHCVNCDQHQLTTRHIIESYSNKYNDLQRYLQSQFLPVYIHANTKACLSFSKTPRVGAFEVTIQPYTAASADLVYSKIRNKVFPTIKAISNIIKPFSIPNYTIYPADGMLTICVHVYDAYYKQPIENVLVQIHQLYSYFKPEVSPKSPVKISNIARTSDNYALVRTWAREDVVRWFRAYEVPENDIIVALNAGVTTGPALITLVTPSSLRSWGIKNLLLIQKLMLSIDSMKKSKLDSVNSEDVGRIMTGITSTPSDLDSMLYCQEIKRLGPCYSSRLAPKSNMRYNSNDFDCRSIDQGYTDENGIFTRALATSGTYMLKIQSPLTSDYSSHIIALNTDDSKFVCVTLQPLLALVRFSMPVTRENIQYKNIKYLENGVLIAVVNLITLRRHNILLRPSSGRFLSLAVGGDVTEGANYDDNVGMPTCDFIQGETFLPLGRYLSLVDGSVFSVFSSYKATKTSLPMGANCYIDVTEKQSLRCHQRQVQVSVKIFKRMYRKRLQRSAARKMYTLFLIRIRIGRKINQARVRIKHRKATIIQAAMRRYIVYRRYKLIISVIIILQACCRRHLARLYIARLKEEKRRSNILLFDNVVGKVHRRTKAASRRIIGTTVLEWYRSYQAHKHEASVKIQRNIRGKFSRVKTKKKIFIKSNKKKFTPLMKHYNHRVEQKRIRVVEQKNEREELVLMAREELGTKKYLRAIARQQKEEKQRIRAEMDRKVALLERQKLTAQVKQGQMSTRIQRVYRGYAARRMKRKCLRGIIQLQAYVRRRFAMRLYSKLVRTTPPRPWQHKYKVPAHLIKRKPILQVMSSRFSMYIGDRVTEGLHHMKMNYFKSGLISQEKVKEENPMITILNGMTATKVVKIQSLVRKRIARKKYLKKIKMMKNPTQLSLLNTKYLSVRSTALVVSDDAPDASSNALQPASMVAANMQVAVDSATKLITRSLQNLGAAPIALQRQASRARDSILQNATSIRSLAPSITTTNALRMLRHVKDNVEEYVQLHVEPIALESVGKFRKYISQLTEKYGHPRYHNAAVKIQCNYRGARCRIKFFSDVSRREYIIRIVEREKQHDYPLVTPMITKIINGLQAAEANSKRFRPNLSITTNSSALVKQINEAERDATFHQSRPGSRSHSLAAYFSLAATPVRNTLAALKSTAPGTPLAALSNTIAALKSTAPGTPLAAISDGLKKASNITAQIVEASAEQANNMINKAIISSNNYMERQKTESDRVLRKENNVTAFQDGILNIRGTLRRELPSIDASWYIVTVLKLRKGYKEKADTGPTMDEKKWPLRLVQEEVSESPKILSFTPLTFRDLSYYVHLCDISRYYTLEIELFIETQGRGTGLERDGTQSAVNVKYVTAYKAEYNLDCGTAFSPMGGIGYAKLVPSLHNLIYIAKSRNLITVSDLELTITLLPIALPSSQVLETFQSAEAPALLYPSQLIDVEPLELRSIQYDVFNAAAVCAGVWRDKLFVSSRNKLFPYGIYEYNLCNEGDACVYKRNIGLTISDVGITVAIVAGFRHVMCCTNEGYSMVYCMEGSGASKTTSNNYEENSPVLLHLHSKSITHCCVTTHANIDFFFTCDKNQSIVMTAVENGSIIRSLPNHPFISAKITSMQAADQKLYISSDDGMLATITLHYIFALGNIDTGGSLHRYNISTEKIFVGIHSSISTMALMLTPEMYCNFKHKKRTGIHDTEIDYLILVGGGDKNPIVKIIKPKSNSYLDVKVLQGHGRAITSIVVDAAGRYIITASSAENKIIIWDAITYLILKKFDDINVASLVLGPDSLIVTSYKPPFLSLWKSSDKHYDSNRKRLLANPDDIHFNDIKTVRNARWCYGMLTNTNIGDTKSLIRPAYIEEDNSVYVFNRWKTQYTRASRETNGNLIEKGKNNTTKYERAQTPKAKLRREDERKHYQEESLRNAHAKIEHNKTDDCAGVVDSTTSNPHDDNDDDNNDQRVFSAISRTEKRLVLKPHHDSDSEDNNSKHGTWLSQSIISDRHSKSKVTKLPSKQLSRTRYQLYRHFSELDSDDD